MKQHFYDCGNRCLWVLVILLIWTAFLSPAHTRADVGPGLSLTLYIDQQAHPDFQYLLGEEVELTMVLKNVSGRDINAERGFSQVELQRSLVVTDPGGTRHSLTEETLALTPQPPLFWKDLATKPAETLPPGWVRSVTILDLADLFPMMGTNPGWYTIEAHLPFIRYVWTVKDQQLGLLGVEDSDDNWRGAVYSNKIQIYISPSSGGRLKVRVLDGSVQPANPLAQVPVKVFEGAIQDEDLSDAWALGNAVLDGTTDPSGYTSWDSGESCKQENDYTAIAYRAGEYKAAHFLQEDQDWAPGCAASIEREILFTQALALNKFSVYAFNSVWIKEKATVFSGNIGARDKCGEPGEEPCLNSNVEVSIGSKVQAKEGVQIFGDSVKIAKKASVHDVYYNNLYNSGTIRGAAETPLVLPVETAPLSFPNITPGDSDVTVKQKKTLDLPEGFYGDVRIKAKGKLRLQGGTYHMRSLDLDPNSLLVCLEKTEIRIQGRLHTGPNAYVGPFTQDLELSAKNVFLYIGGINGEDGGLESEPKAAEIGNKNEVKANIFAPKGTLWINNGSDVEGSFIAKDVIIGEKAKVWLESGF